jgi:hypothetical protein
MTVWVVGQYREPSWDIQGVFSSEEKAVAACRHANYFVGPMPLDADLPDALQPEWPGAYYPHARLVNGAANA